jgi:hypothetical protein
MKVIPLYPIIWARVRVLATSRKVTGSRTDVVNEFFSIHLILPAALGPSIYSGE